MRKPRRYINVYVFTKIHTYTFIGVRDYYTKGGILYVLVGKNEMHQFPIRSIKKVGIKYVSGKVIR